MTCQKVVKSRLQKFSPQSYEMSSRTSLSDHCNSFQLYICQSSVFEVLMPSVLWCCWLGGRKGIRPVKNWAVGCWRGYLSGARCRLAYGQAVATATRCRFSKIQIGFIFLIPAHPGSPGQRAVKRVCVCVCVCVFLRSYRHLSHTVLSWLRIFSRRSSLLTPLTTIVALWLAAHSLLHGGPTTESDHQQYKQQCCYVVIVAESHRENSRGLFVK